MNQQSRSDNIIVAVFVLAALVAAAQPLLIAMETLGWPSDTYFPTFWLLTAVAITAYAARRWGHLLIDRPVIWPIAAAVIIVRFTYYTGRHWAELSWLLEYVGNVLTFGHQMGATLLILAAWAVGSIVANNGVDHDASLTYVTNALPLLIGGTFICGLSRIREAGVNSAVTTAVFIYLACTLITLSLAQLELVRSRCRMSAGSRPVWQWIPIATLAILIIVAVTAGLAAAVDPRIPGIVISSLRFGLNIIATALGMILYPLAFVVAVLFNIGQYLISLLSREKVVEWEPISGGAVEELIKIERIANMPDLRWLLAIVLLLFALVMLGSLLRSRPSRSGNRMMGIDEQRMTISRGKQAPPNKPSSDIIPVADDVLASQLAVRQTYSQVLEWAGRHAFPRLPHLTVTQFNARLMRLLRPEQITALQQLTELYVPVRYGTLIPEQTTVERAQELAATITKQPLTYPDSNSDH